MAARMTPPGFQGMLPAERRAWVVELLRRRGIVRVHDLADELDVSTITVRRDIAQLAAEGLVSKVHGGATLRPDAAGNTDRQPNAPDTDPTAAPSPAAEYGVTLGMIVPSLDYYWPGVIRGAREAAAKLNVRIVLRGTTYDTADERCQLGGLVESAGVDGLLVAPTVTGEEGAALMEWLLSTDVPVVLVEHVVEDPHHGALESVVSDHALGAAIAVRHLAELGHARVGICTSITSLTSLHLRRGWRQACEDLGMPVDGTTDVQGVDHRSPACLDDLDRVLDTCAESGTTALLVHSNPEAISLVGRCQERGIKVPGELAVVTYDDDVAELCDPPLTAVRLPKAEVGRAAVDLLVGRLRHGSGNAQSTAS